MVVSVVEELLEEHMVVVVEEVDTLVVMVAILMLKIKVLYNKVPMVEVHIILELIKIILQ
jgi:hypothetical protein